MGLTQEFTGLIEPSDPDWGRASSAVRKRYYDQGGQIVLDELRMQLEKAVGRNGRTMKPRIRPVLPDGADGPVMIPHELASRAITMSDYAATDHGLKLFWHAGTGHRQARKIRKKGGKPVPFGDILGYHADGLVPGAPVRDVRLCAQRIANVKRRLGAVWAKLKPHVPRPPTPPPGKPAGPKPKGTSFTKKQQAKFKPPPLPKRMPKQTKPDTLVAPGEHPTPTSPLPVFPAIPKTLPKGRFFVVEGMREKFAKATKPQPPPKPKPAPKPKRVTPVPPAALPPKPVPVALAAAVVPPRARLPTPAPVKAPATIADRIAAYSAGDAKIAAIQQAGAAVRHAKVEAEATLQRLQDHTGKMTPRDWEATNTAAEPKRAIANRLLQEQIEASKKVEAAAQAARAQVFGALEVPFGDRLILTGKSIDRLPENVRDLAASTAKSVGRLVKTDKPIDFHWITFGAGEEQRAYHQGYTSSVRFSEVKIGEKTPREVIAHELGHAIEWQVPGIHERVMEFLEHRCGSEQPQSLDSLFPTAGYKPHEMGRKDDFDRYFSGSSAYYVGMPKTNGNSEVLSMGIQALFENPAKFAKVDPEFCKFILGILDGSIR